VAARNNAIAAGITEISAEGIGDIPAVDVNWLRDSIVYPAPGTIAPPWTSGWVYLGDDKSGGVESAGEFMKAICEEIPPPPVQPTPTPTPTPKPTPKPFTWDLPFGLDQDPAAFNPKYYPTNAVMVNLADIQAPDELVIVWYYAGPTGGGWKWFKPSFAESTLTSLVPDRIYFVVVTKAASWEIPQ
jgi:hypothetical protein